MSLSTIEWTVRETNSIYTGFTRIVIFSVCGRVSVFISVLLSVVGTTDHYTQCDMGVSAFQDTPTV